MFGEHSSGTAINFFVRDLPRLSVDIDLHYLPVHERPESLREIDAALKRIAESIEESISGSTVNQSKLHKEDAINKLIVRLEGVQIKIEVTPVFRGAVYEPEIRPVTTAVEEDFGFAEMQVVSFADRYAGKIVAALDRQHPRDLFDIANLYKFEGISDGLRTAFVVYLLSHMRPTHEVLGAKIRDISSEYEQGFVGMTDEPVELSSLVAAGERLSSDMVEGMPDEHRQFLLAFTRGDPDWNLLGLANAENLPAIKWKQLNLDKLHAERRERLVDDLAGLLD